MFPGFDAQLLTPGQAKAHKMVSMPGANGPITTLSTGAKPVEIIGDLPFFVDRNGKQLVKLEDGTWEMIFRQNAFAGTLLFGFSIPEGASKVSF